MMKESKIIGNGGHPVSFKWPRKRTNYSGYNSDNSHKKLNSTHQKTSELRVEKWRILRIRDRNETPSLSAVFPATLSCQNRRWETLWYLSTERKPKGWTLFIKFKRCDNKVSRHCLRYTIKVLLWNTWYSHRPPNRQIYEFIRILCCVKLCYMYYSIGCHHYKEITIITMATSGKY